MSDIKKAPYYVTTPIYYVNDAPHIGHAYTTLACDVLARFKRLDGHEVMFLTGTDEHGQKVEKSARAAGMEPQAFTDKVAQNFRDLADAMSFSYDDFIRTTEDRHVRACQAIWQAIAANKTPKGTDNIYLGSYSGWYAVRDEAFYGEDELEEGPGGKKIARSSGAEVEWVEEPSYFFRLSDWRDWLLEHYEANPDFIAPPGRRNEVVSFVSGELHDLSISRTTFNWGVPVPDDPDHVIYVWLDALTNYITAAGYPDQQDDKFARFWPADLHMVGKDILRFHAVYWPAFLAAAGLAPPKRVFAHGWWTNEGQKISKSLGNVIDPFQLVEQYGLDQVRYFLLREVPFGNDGDFSHRGIVSRINSELANDFGNLAQRVLSMIAKNCGGKVPELQGGIELHQDYRALSALIETHEMLPRLRTLFDQQAFHEALTVIWSAVREANQYVDSEAPWVLRKSDPLRMQSVLYVLAETIRHLAILLWPFMPSSCSKMLDQLAVPDNERYFACLNVDRIQGPYSLKPGTPLPKPQGVFPRYVDEAEAAS